jgi:hypothetical protein
MIFNRLDNPDLFILISIEFDQNNIVNYSHCLAIKYQ